MLSSFFLSFIVLFFSFAHAQEPTGEQSFEARIVKTSPITCSDASRICQEITAVGRTSSFKNKTVVIKTEENDALGGKQVLYEAGQTVIVQTETINGEPHYFISDIVRRSGLIALSLLFVAAVMLFGGLSALRSFFGLAVSFAVILFFMIPRMLAGDSPVLISLIASLFIMIVTFLLCHGWNRKTLAAFAGTGASLIFTFILAGIFTSVVHLTGTADEEMLFLLSDFPDLNTKGILLAGIVIGTLGVLDDITIAQSSAVFELRKANARMTALQLYKSAYRIGSDHIAAAVNTLMLAYAGSSLPLLLLLVGVPSGEAWFTFINREMIAQEIVRTLVGSVGLLAAVPLTTFIAALLAIRTNASAVENDNRKHAHGG